MSDEEPLDEKLRTCPSCRTPISVLASKCKFCGEVVGKPKEEQRQLSINDLGGESIHHRAISSSVMDALEAFRIEDDQNAGEGKTFGGLDSLDNEEDSAFDNYAPMSSVAPVRAASVGSRIALLAKIAVALVVIGVLAVKLPGYLKETFGNTSNATVDVYVNQAMMILEEQKDVIRALETAGAATREAPGPENAKIADDVIMAANRRLQVLLNAQLWNRDKLKEATAIATKAVAVFPNAGTRAMKKEVDQENSDYLFFLVKANPRNNTAEFSLNSPGTPKVTVKVEGTFAGRFKLTRIPGSSSVTLIDTLRNNRVLNCALSKNPQ